MFKLMVRSHDDKRIRIDLEPASGDGVVSLEWLRRKLETHKKPPTVKFDFRDSLPTTGGGGGVDRQTGQPVPTFDMPVMHLTLDFEEEKSDEDKG